MMIGQDKSVFKQYSFGHKCWMGPVVEIQLLLKSDGYSRMVSVFVSQDLGVGLHLTKTELNEVNDRRSSENWGSYLSKDDTFTIYGTIKKKKILVPTWRDSGITT